MRITVDLPAPMLHQLKSRAALEGITIEALVQCLLNRGLNVPPDPPSRSMRSPLPSIATGQRLPLRKPSNAALFKRLDDA